MLFRRFLPFFLAAGFATILLFAVVQRRGLELSVPWHLVGLGADGGPTGRPTGEATDGELKSGEQHGDTDDHTADADDDAGHGRDWRVFAEPKVEHERVYPMGKTKPAGSNYTKGLVLPKLKREDTSWVEEELGDLIDQELLNPYIYTVDDRTAALHPLKNKGHEVMVYLSYIVDHYEKLPDVSIFMHAHRYAWHNNELLNTDAAAMVRSLSPERVTREGYMNLRCHWDPGCPVWLHPGSTQNNRDKPEEVILADSWTQLFPLDPIPTVLAQPCCGQFAVSRDRILAMNKMRYIYMRDWIIRTDLTDYLSGRVFEYIWQFVFSKTAVHCPSMSACYCDGYGICFGSPEAFDEWFKLKYEKNQFKEELKVWKEKAQHIKTLHESAGNGKIVEEAKLDVPEVGMDTELEMMIAKLEGKMEKKRQEAIERGNDPEQRAKGSGREWVKGDGF